MPGQAVGGAQAPGGQPLHFNGAERAVIQAQLVDVAPGYQQVDQLTVGRRGTGVGTAAQFVDVALGYQQVSQLAGGRRVAGIGTARRLISTAASC